MSKITKLLLLLVLSLQFIPLQNVTAETATGKFYVSGNKIIDPNGNRFVVKGMATQYQSFMPESNDGGYGAEQLKTVDRDFDYLKSKGINTIRIFVTGKYVYFPNTDAFLQKLYDVVAKARQRNFVVLLTGSYSNPTELTNTIKILAAKYANDSYVWITPSNETHCADHDQASEMPNGYPDQYCDDKAAQNQPSPSWQFWQTEHNGFLKTIRDTGNNNIVLVNTNQYSWDLRRIKDYRLTYNNQIDQNIVYGAHRYANDNTVFDSCINDYSTEMKTCVKEIDAIKALWADQAATLPIVVDEVGNHNYDGLPDGSGWMDGMTKFLATWVNQPTAAGSGAIAFNWFTSDLNSISGKLCNNNYDDAECNNQNPIVLTAWGSQYFNNYVSKVIDTPVVTPTPTITPTTPCTVTGDFNADCKVDLKDLSIFLTYYKSTDPTHIAKYDINKNGSIGGEDLSILLINIK